MISFDELFAHRIYYQDITFDEFYIIRKLKQLLVNDGMAENETNNYLFDFYNNFGHSMNLEDIESVTLTEHTNTNTNIISSFFNLINSYQDQLNNIDENTENTMEENASDGDVEENGSDADIEDNVSSSPNDSASPTNHESPSEQNNQIPDLPVEHIHIDFSLNLPNTFEIPNNNLNDIPLNIPVNLDNQNQPVSIINSLPSVMINNNLLSNNNFSFQYNNLIDNTNIINQLLGQVINIPQVNQNQEDINVTMDKEDIDNLTILKYNDIEPVSCSICLGDVEKDNEYYKIKCNHIFHKKCLEKWLEEYNYLCPVCRTELGKSKAHLENNDDSSSIHSEDNV